MNAIITIETIDGLLTFETPITFSPVELPYGAIGFGNNGSSMAEPSSLTAYWTLIKSKLTSPSEYIMLKNITYDGTFYGITE
jgi:hypothetical protein